MAIIGLNFVHEFKVCNNPILKSYVYDVHMGIAIYCLIFIMYYPCRICNFMVLVQSFHITIAIGIQSESSG